MNEKDKRELYEKLERLIEAINRQKTIVPLFIYIPQTIRPDELENIGKFITETLAEAGFDLGKKG